MPSSLPLAVPSSVTATVEWPVFSFSARISASVCVRADVGIADDKARLIALDAGDHRGLALDGLRAVDKGNAALLGQGDGHLVVGNRLHDGGDQRDVRMDRAGLLALAELDDRGAGG